MPHRSFMAVIRKTRAERLKEFWARYSKFAKAAAILALVFFVVSACTIGGFNSPGRAYFARADAELVFYLDYDTSKTGDDGKLGAIYANIGAVYAPVGSDFKLTFNKSSATSSSGPAWSSNDLRDAPSFGNVYSAGGDGLAGANYNWVKVFDFSQTKTKYPISQSYRLIRITVPHDMLINEIVFVDASGDVIPASVTVADAQGHFSGSVWKEGGYYDLFNGNDRTSTLGAWGDPERLVDAQNNFTEGRGAYSNFTQDEMYTLMQIDNILLGSTLPEGTYNADTDSGPLAVLFPLLGTLIFGKSVFGLRIFSVLFTSALVALVWMFGKKLFKNEGFAFLAAVLFAGGGLALTVGRLGVSLAPAAFFVLASYYFIYKFFENGIAAENPAKSACGSILASGIFFALAFAVDPKTLIAAVGVVALFVLGAIKQVRAHSARAAAIRQEMRDKNASETSEQVMRDNIAQCEKAEAALRVEYSYQNRLTYLLFFLAFVVVTLAVLMLATLPSYLTYVNLYDPNPESASVGIFSLVGSAIKDAFSLDNATLFSAGNSVNAFGWFLALKGATLFFASEDVYCALNAQLNIAMALTALVGVLFMTVYAILYAATGGKKGQYATEHSAHILRIYLVLILGLLSSLLQYAFIGGASAAHGFLFDLFYTSFIPLMFYTAYVHDSGEKKVICGIRMNSTAKVMAVLCTVYALIFLLSLPMYFSIPVYPLAASICFGWTSFMNNGFYR